VGSEASFIFGSFFSWVQGILDNLLSCDLYLFHDTCNTMIYLGFTHGLILGLCNLLSGGDNLSWCRRLCSYFLVVEARNFSPSFPEARTHLSQCCGLTRLYCQNSLCCRCLCCTWWVLWPRSPWEFFSAALVYGSVIPLTC
jgi:hypothetical protein